jgi:DNA-binding transcriptional MerR regulator
VTIQEAAQASGWSPRMLRYVELSGLVAPGRTKSGYRDYTPDDVERLRALKRLIARTRSCRELTVSQPHNRGVIEST